MHTFSFWQLIDEDSEAWILVNREKYPHLFPDVEGLSEDIMDNIREHFYTRQIGFSSPQDFLRHFHRLIKERIYTWTKMLETEKALRDEDMIYNYDMQEDSSDSRTGNSASENTRVPDLTVSTEEEATGTSRQMDTPDAITTDIDTYLSAAGKDTSKTERTQKQTGSEQTAGRSQYGDKNTHHLTRKGNIGVMTAAQIMAGYREAQLFDTYEQVIFPEVDQLMLAIVEPIEVDMW